MIPGTMGAVVLATARRAWPTRGRCRARSTATALAHARRATTVPARTAQSPGSKRGVAVVVPLGAAHDEAGTGRHQHARIGERARRGHVEQRGARDDERVGGWVGAEPRSNVSQPNRSTAPRAAPGRATGSRPR